MNVILVNETVTDNLLIRIQMNKFENKITFKIETEPYLDFLMP